jgi:hypothetical protein
MSKAPGFAGAGEFIGSSQTNKIKADLILILSGG